MRRAMLGGDDGLQLQRFFQVFLEEFRGSLAAECRLRSDLIPALFSRRTWARSVELQIQEHDVGDLYAVGSAIAVRAKPRAGTQPTLYDYDPSGEWTFFSQIQGSSGRCIKQPDNENPTGEWNTVELIAFHDDAIHIVNGKVVMRLHGPMRIDSPVPTPINSGQIILQSEGAEVFYRDIQIKQISAIPPEFAAK